MFQFQFQFQPPAPLPVGLGVRRTWMAPSWLPVARRAANWPPAAKVRYRTMGFGRYLAIIYLLGQVD
jgi:hypothetical protein